MTRTLSIAALSLFAATSFTFAMTDSTDMSRDTMMKKNDKTEKPLNVQCIQNALEKRDAAIITAHGTYNTSIVAALTARKDGLKSAWAKVTRAERKEARNGIWNTFRTSHKSAHEGLRTIRKASWSTFDIDMKACGVTREAHGESANISSTAIGL